MPRLPIELGKTRVCTCTRTHSHTRSPTNFKQGVEAQGRDAKMSLAVANSYLNTDEASVVLRLMLIMGTDPTVKDIAIVTPYNAQASGYRTCV